MSHLDFTLALHRVLAPGQVCWSPFSVAGALGLLARGARGRTRDELVALVGDPDEVAHLLAASGLVASPDDEQSVLAVANTLWADASVDLADDFVRALVDGQGGAVRTAPFHADREKARAEINTDVAETTRGLIEDLLPPGSITPDTASTMVSALYLKCAWLTRFAQDATEPRVFTTPTGPVEVPTMSFEGNARYAAQDGWQVVALPAAGGTEAVILFPDDDLATAEPGLTAESLTTLLAAPHRARIALHLPRLALTTHAELTAPLTALGVHTVFGDQADLTGIARGVRLRADSIHHESVLRVDEEGFEGAAATAVVFELVSLTPTVAEIHVDRPFLLLVRHQRTGAVYFMTRVTDPS
ncbi:serpin family protein [Actinokineospora enzanensis]|uniref:serpin family protein n=1 Tax=Actinokineospora enzanensis TaxID=155975 RepID=UPI00036D7320|nr:serpin family protein [Actinokineospora enzanensis]